MATFDPILHEHEKRLAVLETARRKRFHYREGRIGTSSIQQD